MAYLMGLARWRKYRKWSIPYLISIDLSHSLQTAPLGSKGLTHILGIRDKLKRHNPYYPCNQVLKTLWAVLSSLAPPTTAFKLYCGWRPNFCHKVTALIALRTLNRIKSQVHFYSAIAWDARKIIIRHFISP